MLYRDPNTTSRTPWHWLKRVIVPRPAHQLTDIRELSPYLRADIGAPGGNYPFRS